MENEDKYALSEAWLRGKDYKDPFDYTIEASGQTVLIRRLDMGDLLRLGVAEQMDVMSKALMAEDKPSDEPEQDAREVVSNAILKAGNFEQMEGMVNVVCCEGILKPKLYLPPAHEAARQKGLYYVDSVPFTDRMELFSVIFEAEGLASFREEQDDGVGNLADVPSVSLPADRPVDIRPDDTEGVLLQSGSVPVRENGRSGDEQSGTDVESKSTGTSSGSVSEHSEVGSSEQVSQDRTEALS